jgi:hypothetical protein
LTDFGVVDLAGRGFSAAYISRSTGLNYKLVTKLLKSEYTDRNANRQQIIEAHSQQVNWLKLKITERMHEAGKGWDRKDAELLLKVLERESKLFGTDQPTQSQVNVTIEELSDEDLWKQLAAQGIEVKQLAPPQVTSVADHIEDAVIDEHPQTHTVAPAAAGQTE